MRSCNGRWCRNVAGQQEVAVDLARQREQPLHEPRQIHIHAFREDLLDAPITCLCCERRSRRFRVFCVTDRLPAESVTITRSPALLNTRILSKREMWSMPALVRESDANTMPVSSFMATQ